MDESDENETSAPTHSTMTPIISTSTLQTTTTTTTTTAPISTSRPVITTTTQHNYDRKDSRFYNDTSSTPTHSNNDSQTTQNSPVKTSIKNSNVQFNNNGKCKLYF